MATRSDVAERTLSLAVMSLQTEDLLADTRLLPAFTTLWDGVPAKQTDPSCANKTSRWIMCQQNKQIHHVPAKQADRSCASKTKEAKRNDHVATKQRDPSNANKTKEAKKSDHVPTKQADPSLANKINRSVMCQQNKQNYHMTAKQTD